MDHIGNIEAAEQKVLSNASALLTELASLVRKAPKSAAEAVGMLAQIRDVAYEDLNQIQHEFLILVSAKHLVSKGLAPATAEWQWNPRQTGGANEPDLQAKMNDGVLISAEITTSRRPIGTILNRIGTTLTKLNGFKGSRYYFVRTSAMARKAQSICTANNYQIAVIHLPHVEDDL